VRLVVFRATIRKAMIPNHLVEKAVGGGPEGRFHQAFAVALEAVASRAFPGCAFGVWANGQIQLQDAAGRFTYEPGARAVTPGTVFDIASVTKVVATTAAAMLLVQLGQLQLDTLIGELLPEFLAGRTPGDPARSVTLRHLLAHSSGLPGYVEFFRQAQTADALLSACLRLSLGAEPGTRAEYSDPGFILLGKALEVSMGESMDRWTAREIFQPLGFEATRFCPEPAQRPMIPPTEEDVSFRKRRIQGAVQDENAWVLGGVAGHAGLFSNVPDLLRFSAAVLDGASSSGSDGLFQAGTIDLFSQRQLPSGSSRALGWDTPSENSSSGMYFSPRSIGHLGYSGCSLWIDFESAVAVVLLTNRTWPDRASQLIRQLRPAFHNAIREAL
jgi:serine-type D-Ala-D-Ala carboxypeptidase